MHGVLLFDRKKVANENFNASKTNQTKLENVWSYSENTEIMHEMKFFTLFERDI